MCAPLSIEKELKRILAAALTVPGLRKRGPKANWIVGVKLVGAAQMKALNGRYRKQAKPTDVLSFPAEGIFRDLGALGDLVVCRPVLKRQAQEMGHSEKTELRVLLVHGLLHLLGFDHEKGAQAKRTMRSWEARLLGKIAVRSRGLVARGLKSARP